MARARFYTVGKIKRINGEYVTETLPNKGLYANGIYPTKLTLDDLTPDFIELFKGRRVCFMKASGVKDLLYSPNYFVDNHLFKDDFLYISYDKKIQEKADKSFLGRYEGYDEIIWGWSILLLLFFLSFDRGEKIGEAVLGLYLSNRQYLCQCTCIFLVFRQEK